MKKLFILPIRNGNLVTFLCCFSLLLSFYPTYKEWKPEYNDTNVNEDTAFYPTYKEWKRR